MIRKPTRKRAIATHEAGHAVIARVLTVPSGSVSIIKNEYSLGRSTSLYNDDKLVERWELCGKPRGISGPTRYGAAIHTLILTTMAGVEAEKIILGGTIAGSNEVDDDMIMHWAFELTPPGSGADWPKIETRQMTRMLVRRHRDSIERVADELLTKGKLTGRQISRLIERSPVPRLCRDCRMDTTPCAGGHAHRRTTPTNLRCQHKGRWEYYMVHNSVWKQAGMPVRRSAFPSGATGFLCIGCLEQRLRRTLTDDFPDLPINEPDPSDTERLARIKQEKRQRSGSRHL